MRFPFGLFFAGGGQMIVSERFGGARAPPTGSAYAWHFDAGPVDLAP